MLTMLLKPIADAEMKMITARIQSYIKKREKIAYRKGYLKGYKAGRAFDIKR